MLRPEIDHTGVYLVDKPPGPTSFRLVSVMKRLTGIKKVGHAGTLDPFASGLLVICVGRPATRLVPHFMEGAKKYEAVIRLGVVTDTMDTEGKTTQSTPVPAMDMQHVAGILETFIGEQQQQPPYFSAVKYKGRPLYAYAREGIKVDKEPRTITIHEIEPVFVSSTIQGAPENLLGFKVRCSKGTYIRVLAEDIGRALGCGGHLKSLRRTASDFFHIKDAIPGGLLMRQNGAVLLQKNCISVPDIQKKIEPVHQG